MLLLSQAMTLILIPPLCGCGCTGAVVVALGVGVTFLLANRNYFANIGIMPLTERNPGRFFLTSKGNEGIFEL
jgi:hypothetical protein